MWILHQPIHTLSRPISPASLAVIRILFALLMIQEVVLDTYESTLLEHSPNKDGELPFYFPLVDGLPRPTPLGVNLLFSGMGVCLVLIGLGLFYRVAIVIYTLLTWYWYCLQSNNWTNHVSQAHVC